MAQKYRKVDPRIWDDEQFDNLDAVQSLAALWLLTSDNIRRCGVVVFTLGLAADKLRHPLDTVWDTLSTVCVCMGWPIQKVSRSTVVVIMPSWFKHNPPSNADHLKGMLSDLADVPRCDTVSTHYPALKTRLNDCYHGLFDTIVCECVGHPVVHPVVHGVVHGGGTPCGTSEAEAEAEAEVLLSANGPTVHPPDEGNGKPLTEAERRAKFEAIFNATTGVKQIMSWSDKRKKSFRARLRDPEWPAMARQALRTKFPLQNGYEPNLDQFLRPDTVTEILEGKHDFSKNGDNSTKYDGPELKGYCDGKRLI